MSDLNHNSNNSKEKLYEEITSFIDGEITDDNEKKRIEKLISENEDLRNRYILELKTKKLLKARLKNIDTPLYLRQNIQNGINAEFEKKLSEVSVKNSTHVNNHKPVLQQRKYFYYFASAFVVLLAVFIVMNFVNFNKTATANEDMVEKSAELYERIAAGDFQIQYKTSDAKSLENFFKERCDFQVFVPDLNDAQLLGGVYNEVNGLKAVHFVHKKGDHLIYTLQLKKKDMMDDNDNGLLLTEEFKNNIFAGKNWQPCKRKQSDNVIVWYKDDDVVCSSVSKLQSDEILTTLNNIK
ncbi:MAG TPA: hypothetical protein VHP32_10620 [Ignavibacteria bacterium]|nr:hypothetical protein [Ignavibacteria bacterium]